MKTTTSNPHHAWTPDRQVKALSRLALSIFVGAGGLLITFIASWFLLPTIVVLFSYIGLLMAITVAPIIFFSSGLLSGDNAYQWPKFTDEFCQQVLQFAYRAVVRGLMLLLLCLYFLADLVLVQTLQFPISVSQISGFLALTAMLIWAGTVSIQLHDEEQEA